jgi:putative nucleotidyltransferase with HDIG domain
MSVFSGLQLTLYSSSLVILITLFFVSLQQSSGTFHHSVVVGNLSGCRQEIGANQILTRVGCYYHDIGKIVNPGYFVENQMDTNKHEELNPSLSAKMIILHVRNGINAC